MDALLDQPQGLMHGVQTEHATNLRCSGYEAVHLFPSHLSAQHLLAARLRPPRPVQLFALERHHTRRIGSGSCTS